MGQLMEFLKRITQLFASSPGRQEENAIWIYVRCGRCGEKIRTRVDLRNDLSIEYGEGGPTTYFTRKVIIGEQRCYQPIEVELIFNERRQIINQEISGGEFITKEEYES
jgi:hypothetical protein